MSTKIHRVGVIGSRSVGSRDIVWDNLDELKRILNAKDEHMVVLSGGPKGVDTHAQNWCANYDVPFILFKPYFLVDSEAAYDPRHYFTRNKQIIDNSDFVVAFWDGTTKGTSWGISYARKNRKVLIMVNYGPSQGQCHVTWPFVDVKGKKVTLKDLMHEARYDGRATPCYTGAFSWTCLHGVSTCLHGNGRGLLITALYLHLAKEETVVDRNSISLSRQKCFFGLPIALTPNLLEERVPFFSTCVL